MVYLGLLMQRFPEPDRPFGALTPFVQTVSALARPERVAVAAFGPEDVDPAARRVTVRHWAGPRRGWAELQTGLPDVVWDRYLRRDRPDLLHWLEQQGVRLINRGWLNKWEACRLMQADPALAPHLPETALLEGGAGMALDLLERHERVYIKPVGGSVGRGIVRVGREPHGPLRLQYISTRTGALREVFARPQSLDRWLAGPGRSGRYIAQQGLDLDVFEGRPADVRVLVQKGGDGRWQVTGLGARVAAKGRFTANLHTGGTGLPAQRLVEQLFPGDPGRQRELMDRLPGLALAVASAVDGALGGMGELGVDFGVDRQGRIWCIEQNAQPGRTIFEHLQRPDLWELAHLQPVRYARYLAARKSPGTVARQET